MQTSPRTPENQGTRANQTNGNPNNWAPRTNSNQEESQTRITPTFDLNSDRSNYLNRRFRQVWEEIHSQPDESDDTHIHPFEANVTLIQHSEEIHFISEDVFDNDIEEGYSTDRTEYSDNNIA